MIFELELEECNLYIVFVAKIVICDFEVVVSKQAAKIDI